MIVERPALADVLAALAPDDVTRANGRCGATQHHCPVSRVAFNSARRLWSPHRSDWKIPHWETRFFRDESEAARASKMGEAYALTLHHRQYTQSHNASDERAVSELTVYWKAVNGLPYTPEEEAAISSGAVR